MKTIIEELNAAKIAKANQGRINYEKNTMIAPSVGRTGNMRPLTMKGATCPNCHLFIPVIRPGLKGECRCGCHIVSKVSGNGYVLEELNQAEQAC